MARIRGKEQRGRLIFVAVLFAGCMLLLLYRLIDLQVVQHEQYLRLARQAHDDTHPIPPKRGDLLDRNGHPLAMTVMLEDVQIVGAEIRDPRSTSEQLATVLGMRPADILQKIDPRNQVPLTIKSRLPSSEAAGVKALLLPGVMLVEQPTRAYPEGSLAAQTLGFVGNDFHGLGGLELSFDDLLAGEPGLLQSERDTVGQEIIFGRKVLRPPRNGANLVLSIDRFVQRLAERTLAEAVVANKATGGNILIVEPHTGDLLAAASLPTYRLTDDVIYRPEQESLYKSVIVTDQYEPGSVMKLVTMAAGLDEGAVTPRSTVNDTGAVEVGGAVIKNWNLAGNGVIDMTHVLIFSSNVGSQYVSGLLGPERFYRYVDAFGFGKPTGIRLPGEVGGTVRTPADGALWGRVDLATNAFGQGIAVTPLQMIAAVSAIANDGVLMKPRLVTEVRRPNETAAVEPEQVHRVISPETARTLSQMMIAVFDQQALARYRLPGYQFAGKTGTADLPTTTGYNTGKTYASAVAFGPMPDPVFVILARLDAPEGVYGGPVAVPVIRALAEQLVAYYRIPPRPGVEEARSRG
ncbi:MAG: penicillin-binding protein 2 [Chloroflexi bacterium]|nr:penicillin-binding protein 2 [Chloroflexota bacterium]